MYFSIKCRYSDILLEKTSLITICFAAIHTYCVGMVSAPSASRYVTSALRYQSRSSMHIPGLIPGKWLRQFQLLLVGERDCR